MLPPGQRAIDHFPRFGVLRYAHRLPDAPPAVELRMHVCAIRSRPDYRRSFAERQTRAHPRGRVALEERGRGLPGPVYRLIYRALVPATLWYYRRAEGKAQARSR